MRRRCAPLQSQQDKVFSTQTTTEIVNKKREDVEPEPEDDYWKERKKLGEKVNAGINMLPRGMVGVADATIGGLGIEPVK